MGSQISRSQFRDMVWRGEEEALVALLQADRLPLNGAVDCGRAPLLLATRAGMVRLASALVRHPAVDVAAAWTQTPLRFSDTAFRSDEDAIEGLDVMTLLQWAAGKGVVEVARVLLVERPQLLPAGYVQGREGCSTLVCCAAREDDTRLWEGQAEVARMLLAAGADDTAAVDEDREWEALPLVCAVQQSLNVGWAACDASRMLPAAIVLLEDGRLLDGTTRGAGLPWARGLHAWLRSCVPLDTMEPHWPVWNASGFLVRRYVQELAASWPAAAAVLGVWLKRAVELRYQGVPDVPPRDMGRHPPFLDRGTGVPSAAQLREAFLALGDRVMGSAGAAAWRRRRCAVVGAAAPRS
jgi:hypothetical protein